MLFFFKLAYVSLVLSPLFTIFYLLQVSHMTRQKLTSLSVSFFMFILTILLLLIYINGNNSVRFLTALNLHSMSSIRIRFFPFLECFYFDFLTLHLLLLTSFIFCLVTYYINKTVFVKYNYYMISIFMLWFILNIIFCTMNLLLFYFLFELSLLPMFIIIGIWGNRVRKVHAAVFFVMYTSVLSFFFLFALLFIYYWVHTFDFLVIKHIIFSHTFKISQSQLQLFWMFSIIAFFAKLPIFPFHIWLPEAHVEAPTAGSVILASILLKIGAYAIIRFLLPFSTLWGDIFGVSFARCLTIIKVLLWISLLYSSLIIITQVDLKKIIAYSSIIHMSLSMIGFFSGSVYGAFGGYLMLIAHGFTSAGLFFIAGMLYSRFGTRLLKYYSGVHLVAPKLSFFAFFFFIMNIGFPGSLNFISEFLIFLGIVNSYSIFFIFILGFCFVTSLLYSVWVYNRIFLGTFSLDVFENYYDLYDYEYNILATLACATVFFGIFPNFII